MCSVKPRNVLSLLVVLILMIGLVFAQPLLVIAKGLPAGMKEQHLTAEAVYDYGKDVYFDESGNQVEDYASSYYGAAYKVKYVLDFWNAGALSSSIYKKYSTATITAVYTPEGPAYVSDEGKMVREARAPWENKHFDEYKNDPAWVEANKKVMADIEAIKSKALPTLKEPVQDLYFTGGPDGEFKVLDTSKTVGKVVQKGAAWVVEFPEGINHCAHTGYNKTGSLCLFYEFKILTNNPFGENENDSGVRFSDFTGNVEVQPAGEDYWNLAELLMVLYYDDHIRTGVESLAWLSFKDMTTYMMKPETEIVLSRPAEKETRLQLVAGNLWVNVKKMIEDGTMEVTMNQAVTGIKGTIFVCEETGTTSTLKVIEGEVEFTDKNGKTVMVGSGEKVSATSSGMGEKESFGIEAEKEAWAEFLDSEAMPSESETDKLTGKENLSVIIGTVALALVVIAGSAMIMSKRKRNKEKG